MSEEKRLLQLANYLEKRLEDTDFDIRTWEQVFGKPRCAVGWAPTWFEPEGFDIVSTDGSDWTPVYETSDASFVGWKAVAAFFDISEEEAVKLFGSTEDLDGESAELKTRVELIEEIRDFMIDVGRVDWPHRTLKKRVELV